MYFCGWSLGLATVGNLPTSRQTTSTDVVNVVLTGGSSRDPQLLEMDETTTQKQEQMTMQTERELQELEEREQDIRQLEVNNFIFTFFFLISGYRANNYI